MNTITEQPKAEDTTALLLVCAWCGKWLSTPDSETECATAAASHGICAECQERLVAEFQDDPR